MISLSQSIMIYSIRGFSGSDPIFENHGRAIAYDPEDHSFAAPGMSLAQFRATENVILKYQDQYRPKWADYSHHAKGQLAASCVEYQKRLADISGTAAEQLAKMGAAS